jgi:hypothetical protein
VLVTEFYESGQIKKDEMGMASNMHRRDENAYKIMVRKPVGNGSLA